MDLRTTSLWTTKPLPTMPSYWSSSCEAEPRRTRVASTGALPSSPSLSSVPESSGVSSSDGSSSLAPCDIGLLERLIRTHPIWFLPALGRAAAVHLLQGKEVGNFVVRQSSKANTMALSVRLPEDKGPHVEHYLIETVGDAQLRLEGSDNNFHAIPMLVAHYSQCCDELPVRLALPSPLAQASSRQELSSMALLGQDFWLSSLVRSPNLTSPPGVSFHNAQNGEGTTHSTFKPNLKNGTSSPSLSPSSSASSPPPPPVAPKHQPHAPPPPPPPRSFQKAASCANIPGNNSESSPEPQSPSSNNNTPDSPRSQPDEANSDSGPLKKSPISRSAHYSQSNIVDLTSTYYKSSLADKISDYEDIWGNNNSSSEDKKAKLKTFFLQSTPTRLQQRHSLSQALHFMLTQGTQTDSLDISESSEMSSPEDQRDKFSSPFYSEPVDSVDVPAADYLPQRLANHRFSDPNLHWPAQSSPCRKIDPTVLDEKRLASLSSSVDNIQSLAPKRSLSTQWVQELNQRIQEKKDSETQVSTQDLSAIAFQKSSDHTKVKRPNGKTNTNAAWSLDSSWEWMGQDDVTSTSSDDDNHLGSFGSKFPAIYEDSQLTDTTTVLDLIAMRSPELSLTHDNLLRASEYDNLASLGRPESEAATEFCEPWDSEHWERLLRTSVPETDILGDDGQFQKEETESTSTVSDVTSEDYPSFDSYKNKSFEERLEPLLAAQRVAALRSRSTSKIGESIRHYIFRLAEEQDNTFSKSIEHFIQCTKESTETKPAVVMRNIRQFMSGIKNYLLKHGEGRFENLLQEGRSKLKPDEFLDIDAVIEDSLHKLVIKPLKSFIYQLFVNEYTRNGSLKLLSDNIKFARTKTPEELGVRPEFNLPEGTSLQVVNHFLTRLQQAYSPLKKLENLLAAISTIYNTVQEDKADDGKEHVSLGAGDFLPIFICVLVRCGLIAAEIEADYMWGLLHPSLMAREGGYYLTTLSSAVHVLKSLQASSPTYDVQTKSPSPEPRLACIADLQGFLKIMIPNEVTGSIVSKTLPIRPNMSTKEVAKLIAHKFNITNPQDYCLFKLVDGEETLLGECECPQVVKADLLAAGSDCLFTYKRCDAKFIWPILNK